MIAIAPATATHINAIFAIEQEAFSEPWSRAALLQEATQPTSVFLVALDEGSENRVLGYISMRCIIDEGHISNIAVAATHKQQGIGSLLIESLAKEARRRQIIALTLEVRTSNHAAIALYEKHGFTAEGIRKNYYSFPTEDGVVMWRYL